MSSKKIRIQDYFKATAYFWKNPYFPAWEKWSLPDIYSIWVSFCPSFNKGCLYICPTGTFPPPPCSLPQIMYYERCPFFWFTCSAGEKFKWHGMVHFLKKVILFLNYMRSLIINVNLLIQIGLQITIIPFLDVSVHFSGIMKMISWVGMSQIW